MPATLPRAEGTLAEIERLSAAGLSAQELIEQAMEHVGRVVPSDGFFVGATDPQTTLPMGAGKVSDLPEELCPMTWDYEFLVPDFMKFTDIARSERPVADLHETTGGRPDRSARWREYASATGFASELRTAFRIGGVVWGIGQFDRLGDAPRYTAEERAWLERVSPVLAAGLRRALVAQPASTPATRGPGIVVLDGSGDVVSRTHEAEAWIEEVEPSMIIETASGFPMPFETLAYAAHVRAEGGTSRRARLRTRRGVWLLMHGSMLKGTDQLAIVIEPAKAADVAPLIVEAYCLTQRELDVTRAIARGLGTAEIAAQLFLSPHTVRDHVKAVFEKVGVSSRGELVAKVFAEHYDVPSH